MAEDSIRQQLDKLLASAEEVMSLLAQVRDEGRSLSRSSGKEVNWPWLDQALTNVRNYRDQLQSSIAARDPVAISYAAEQFVSMRKYFEDASLEWSKAEAELRKSVSSLARQAGTVAFAINPFDPKNLQEIRRALA